MSKVGEGDMENAIRLTKPYTIISSSEFESMLEQLKMQSPLMSQRFGKTLAMSLFFAKIKLAITFCVSLKFFDLKSMLCAGYSIFIAVRTGGF